MTTAAGAALILGGLAPVAQSASLSLASWLMHQTKRAGCWLAEVGPIFISS